jgi:hypothetical protein
MSSHKPKTIKIRKKRHPLTGSIRRKKSERSEIRKLSAPKESSSASSLAEEDDEYLSPVIEECIKVNPGSITETNRESALSQRPNTTDNMDIFNPASVFPFSNKPHETREKTIAEESKQWESFFDPQHTFGPFHTTIKKQTQQFFYTGKWPLDQEDLLGIVPKRKKDGEAATLLFPTVPSPTFPNTDHLELHTTAYDEHDYEEFDGNTSIEILPCPSLSSFPKKAENETVWKDRLELLALIQRNIFDEKWNGTNQPQRKETRKARLHRKIRNKAGKIKKETLVDSSTESEPEPEEKPESVLCLDDSWENISFNPPKTDDLENQQVKRKNRPSFLLFAYGFFFPPLWIVGAFYNPMSSTQRTTTSKKIDLKWKKYSRNAAIVFFFVLVIMVVLVLALKPEAVGFRKSNNQDYLDEEKIIFDDRVNQL